MPRPKLILAIDQGTTSTRAMLFDESGHPAGRWQKELPQIYPKPGWVEHDPEEIWQATLEVSREALAKAPKPTDVSAIGITNQRETSLVWNRRTGQPIHNAIVWQDARRHTNATPLALCCQTGGGAVLAMKLHGAGLEPMIQERTGLLIDPYFS